MLPPFFARISGFKTLFLAENGEILRGNRKYYLLYFCEM